MVVVGMAVELGLAEAVVMRVVVWFGLGVVAEVVGLELELDLRVVAVVGEGEGLTQKV